MAFLDNKEIGKRLKAKRELTNLSPRQFAMRAGVDQSQYAKIEKGKLPITENIMEKLVKAHGLDRNSILQGAIVPRETLNGSEKPTAAQHAPNSQNQGLDLIQEVTRLMGDNLTVKATLKVIISELVPLIAKATGRSHASVSAQMEKDISVEILNLKTLERKQSGD